MTRKQKILFAALMMEEFHACWDQFTTAGQAFEHARRRALEKMDDDRRRLEGMTFRDFELVALAPGVRIDQKGQS